MEKRSIIGCYSVSILQFPFSGVLCWYQEDELVLGEEWRLFIMRLEQWQHGTLENSGFPCPAVGDGMSASQHSQALSIWQGRPVKGKWEGVAVSLDCALPVPFVYLFLPAWIQYCIYLDAYCVQARAEVLGLRGEQSWPLSSWSFQCSVLLAVEEETTQSTRTPIVITRRATNKKCGLWERITRGSSTVLRMRGLPSGSDIETET